MILSPKNVREVALAVLKASEPGLITATRSVWRDMGDSISRSQLATMFNTGNIPASISKQWTEMYSQYVVDKVQPRFEKMFTEAASTIKTEGVELLSKEAVGKAVAKRGTKLIKSLSRIQERSIKAILKHHIVTQPFSQRQLASVLQASLGLTPRDAKRLNALRATLDPALSATQVEKILTRTLNKMSRNRATVVARTELAAAYNSGTQLAIESGVEAGAFDGPVLKEWRTQDDERVCVICGPLDKERVKLNSKFSNGGLLPPAHPQCRCVVLYRT